MMRSSCPLCDGPLGWVTCPVCRDVVAEVTAACQACEGAGGWRVCGDCWVAVAGREVEGQEVTDE